MTVILVLKITNFVVPDKFFEYLWKSEKNEAGFQLKRSLSKEALSLFFFYTVRFKFILLLTVKNPRDPVVDKSLHVK